MSNSFFFFCWMSKKTCFKKLNLLSCFCGVRGPSENLSPTGVPITHGNGAHVRCSSTLNLHVFIVEDLLLY